MIPPIYDEIGPVLADSFRIESVWECGGTINRCLLGESEAMVLARVAMGEAPGNLNDRVYIMWNIKLRAALGFKEALPGYLARPDRWGPETSIYVEALCNGGCQYAPVRAAEGIYFPCLELKETHALRPMLCPTDEQLDAFWWTWTIAEGILQSDLSRFPEALRGFDSFRSPQITWHGQANRPGGLRSVQFFPWGNIWRDEYPQDNEFWRGFPSTPAPTMTTTPVPSRTASPSPTLRPSPTHATVIPSPTPTPVALVGREDAADVGMFFGALILTSVILFIGHLLDLRRLARREWNGHRR